MKKQMWQIASLAEAALWEGDTFLVSPLDETEWVKYNPAITVESGVGVHVIQDGVGQSVMQTYRVIPSNADFSIKIDFDMQNFEPYAYTGIMVYEPTLNWYATVDRYMWTTVNQWRARGKSGPSATAFNVSQNTTSDTSGSMWIQRTGNSVMLSRSLTSSTWSLITTQPFACDADLIIRLDSRYITAGSNPLDVVYSNLTVSPGL